MYQRQIHLRSVTIGEDLMNLRKRSELLKCSQLGSTSMFILSKLHLLYSYQRIIWKTNEDSLSIQFKRIPRKGPEYCLLIKFCCTSLDLLPGRELLIAHNLLKRNRPGYLLTARFVDNVNRNVNVWKCMVKQQYWLLYRIFSWMTLKQNKKALKLGGVLTACRPYVLQ